MMVTRSHTNHRPGDEFSSCLFITWTIFRSRRLCSFKCNTVNQIWNDLSKQGLWLCVFRWRPRFYIFLVPYLYPHKTQQIVKDVTLNINHTNTLMMSGVLCSPSRSQKKQTKHKQTVTEQHCRHSKRFQIVYTRPGDSCIHSRLSRVLSAMTYTHILSLILPYLFRTE